VQVAVQQLSRLWHWIDPLSTVKLQQIHSMLPARCVDGLSQSG
jgi:hypothetical protein